MRPQGMNLFKFQVLLTVSFVDDNNYRSVGTPMSVCFQSTYKGYLSIPSISAKPHVLQFLRDLVILRSELFGAVEDEQDEVGTVGGGTATLDAYLLDRIVGRGDASRIDE